MNTKIPVLNDGFVQLIDSMGNDQSITNAARVSYGNHNKDQNHPLVQAIKTYFPDAGKIDYIKEDFFEKILKFGWGSSFRTVSGADDQYQLIYDKQREIKEEQDTKDRNLIRYLMRHRHTTPFEMVSFVFLVRAPIHVARQWFRHRTWSYNEYSTRYKPAIDSFETTEPDKWRTQAKNNKQGSGEYLTEWPEETTGTEHCPVDSTIMFRKEHGDSPGKICSINEKRLQEATTETYQQRLRLGVAREQARKDLPLSTYTEFYAKVDLHNLFHFLSLRLDAHAQLEIRSYAEALYSLIKSLVPISCQAFEDYRLNGCFFSAQEINLLRTFLSEGLYEILTEEKPESLSDREWKEFKEKLQSKES